MQTKRNKFRLTDISVLNCCKKYKKTKSLKSSTNQIFSRANNKSVTTH